MRSASTLPARRIRASSRRQIDDRRRRSSQRIFLAQVDGDQVAEHGVELVARCGRRRSRTVRAGGRERSGGRQDRERQRVRRARARRSSRRPRPDPTRRLASDTREHERQRARARARRRGAPRARRTERRSRRTSSVGTSTGSVRSRGRRFAPEQPVGRGRHRAGRRRSRTRCRSGTRSAPRGVSRRRRRRSGPRATPASARPRCGRVRPDRDATSIVTNPAPAAAAATARALGLTDLDGDRAARLEHAGCLREEPLVHLDPPGERRTGARRGTSRGKPASSCGSTYGGLLTTRSTTPRSSSGTGSSRSPSITSTSSAERTAFSRASATASGDRSIASTWASGRSSLTASAIAPVPVPTSTIHGSATSATSIERTLHEDLGLRSRDEHAGPHDHVDPAEALFAGEVLERHTDAALTQRAAEPAGLRAGQTLGSRVHGGPVDAQHVGQEDLGRGQRALHVVARQVVGCPADDERRTHAQS